MSDFEYMVGFYGLLLGLAVANVATGFADMWRDREKQAAGWCAPLLAGTVLLGAMNTWLSMWKVHDEVVVDAWQMIAALGICLPYVFVSRAMTPPEDSRIGLEDHYLKSRVPILIALALPPIFSVWSKIRLDHFHYDGLEDLWLLGRIALPAVMALSGRRAVHAVGLAALDLFLIGGLFL
ncbi:MAG: hypothetical protein ABIO29_00215 [Sphingomicrobium sp.]